MSAVRADDLENARAHVVRKLRQAFLGQGFHVRRRHFPSSPDASRRCRNMSVVAFWPKFSSIATRS